MDYFNLGTFSIDAAIEIEKMRLGENFDVKKIKRLICRLEEEMESPNPIFVGHMWIIMQDLGKNPPTIKELTSVLNEELDNLRSITEDTPEVDLVHAREFCLKLNNRFYYASFRRSSRQFVA